MARANSTTVGSSLSQLRTFEQVLPVPKPFECRPKEQERPHWTAEALYIDVLTSPMDGNNLSLASHRRQPRQKVPSMRCPFSDVPTELYRTLCSHLSVLEASPRANSSKGNVKMVIITGSSNPIKAIDITKPWCVCSAQFERQ